MKKALLIPMCLLTIFIIVATLMAPLPARAAGTVGDGTPGSCTEAAFDTALSGGGLVNFNCGAAPFTLTITSQKTIADNTTIDGGSRITLSGGNSTRLFSVNVSVTLNLEYLTLTEGSASVGGAINNDGNLTITNSTLSNNIAPAGLAGAISNQGTLTLLNSTLTNNFGGLAGGALINGGTATITSSTFEGNSSIIGGGISNNGTLTINRSVFNVNTTTSSYGGGIYNSGSLTISTSTFSGNSTSPGQSGGGLYNDGGGTAVINSSLFINNSAPGNLGGGIYNGGQLTITADTFQGNSANGGMGGGIYSQTTNPITITNSTFTDNSGGFAGGGMSVNGPVTVLNSTFYNNNAGGIANGGMDTVSVKNTIMAGNPSDNCIGAITSLGHNLEDATTCNFTAPGDLENTNPELGPLANNGGPTQTLALLAGSPAINAGTNSGCPIADQRGFPRPLLGTCDIGAYEFGSAIFLPVIGK